MYLLGYDIGSSSVKASLVNAETGKCVSSAFFPKTEAAIMAARPGWAEQDPQNWWENLKLSTQAVMAGSGIGRMELPLSVSLIRCTDWFVWIKGKMYYVRLLYGVTHGRFHTGRKRLRHWGNAMSFSSAELSGEFYRFQTGMD